MHRPSQFRRRTRLIPASDIITSLWAASWTIVPAVARPLGLEALARPDLGLATGASFSATNDTGPSSPDSTKGESFLKGFHVVQVSRFSGSSDWSPISRFSQRFATAISNWLSRAFAAPVMSTRHGAHQTTPRSEEHTS